MIVVLLQIFKKQKMPKENASCKCLSIIMLDSVTKQRKCIILKHFWKKCKYEPKKIKMENLIDDDLEKSSSDESDNDFNDDTESDNEKDNDESKK